MISIERRDGRPLLIGHRGALALAPENTLAALRAALEAGVDLIEFDVLALGDGELVLAHSSDLFEVSHGAHQGSLLGHSLAELRTILPALATLDEALAFFAEEARDVGVHLDLKSVGVEREIVAAATRFGVVGRTLVSSTRSGVLRRIGPLEPRIRTCISFPEDRYRLSKRYGSASLIRLGLRLARPAIPLVVGRLLARSRTTAISLQHTLVTPAAVRRAHSLGAAVIAWTILDPGELERVDVAGVDAVVVNDPRMFELRSG